MTESTDSKSEVNRETVSELYSLTSIQSKIESSIEIKSRLEFVEKDWKKICLILHSINRHSLEEDLEKVPENTLLTVTS